MAAVLIVSEAGTTLEEMDQFTRIVVDEAGDDLVTIIQASQPTLATTLESTKAAAAAGVDLVMPSYPLYFNPSACAVQELWWWLTPAARGSGAGGKMFKQIEQWAKERKASALFMIALEDNKAKKMENLYIRAGFKPMERTFIKEVTSWQ